MARSRGPGVAPGAMSALLQELVAAPAGPPADASDRWIVPGLRVGRYELVREIGRGGFGTVWEARDAELGRPVAWKAVRGCPAGPRPERALAEAEIAARLTHPNIVTLYDVGRTSHGAYLVFELLQGQTLAAALASGAVPVEQALHVAIGVASALAHAHARGVVHRDLTPANVFLCADGWVKVLDFGLAAAFGFRKREGGTPRYMAPEQLRGAPEDERTDVFALGVLGYQMLSGELPFARVSGETGAPPLLDVPEAPGLGRLVARMLERDPVDRPRDAGIVLGALRAVRADLGAAAHATGAAKPRARGVAVAVLPFVSRSVGADDAFLGDALAEEILNALARIDALRVVARTSSFAFRGGGGDVREIGRALQVDAVLEGSVQRAGDRLRVTVQLVGVGDGYQLWAERFDREMKDVFTIQDDIAQNVARALRIILVSDGRRAGLRPRPRDVSAYEHYLRGREFLRQTRRASLGFAADMFARAIAIDAEWSPAHAGLAEACGLLHMYYPPDTVELDRADRASERAVELGPDVAEAHASRGLVLSLRRRPAEARRAFERALALDPKLFEAHYYMARACVREGELEEAARLFARANAARQDYQASFFAAQVTEALGRHEEARAAYAEALAIAETHMDLNPDDPRAATMRAVALCRLGRQADGLRWAQQALAIDPQDSGVRYNVACLYALEGRRDDALQTLEEVLRSGFRDTEWMRTDPDLAPLRGDPRFEALLRPT